MIPLLTFAALTSYTVKSGDTLRKIAAANHVAYSQVLAWNTQIKNPNLIYPGQVIKLSATSTKATSTSVTVVKAPNPVTAPVLSATETKLVAYTTAYTYYDNTPAGSPEISDPILHSVAGGTGTFANPVTIAVGHSIINGKDILDYPAGTKFYIPNLRKYFIVEDTCGDGSTPQNGPCHSGYQGHVWLDMWIDGKGSSSSAANNCAEAVTDLHTVIKNPASNYAVVSGAVYGTSCAKQYGDTVVAAI
jgi:hypothetical protein